MTGTEGIAVTATGRLFAAFIPPKVIEKTMQGAKSRE